MKTGLAFMYTLKNGLFPFGTLLERSPENFGYYREIGTNNGFTPVPHYDLKPLGRVEYPEPRSEDESQVEYLERRIRELEVKLLLLSVKIDNQTSYSTAPDGRYN